ncbi:hypothetical protein DFJ67_4874 [Asanoa ferruginea]|uniref:Uncharacterized protein n=1 Tax=Asanoa ferruginea TaxID=53367 RepID=A0A3D9ZNN0_9ACTN|nr:hypothetical protein [Asanoa ferruginea]REF98851.1 hypothetical protein DFJ67_4874 [Asanoa ferruginea]GIF46470.1 hypothetical protein Afe04nite_10090 [Asanoa ferruginea]
MIRRLTPYLLVVLSLAGGLAALSMRPATAAEVKRSADYVVLVGIPGLRWEDVTEKGTPNLWRLAEHGSIGSLSVRSALKPTCPVDGWLTLGAGNFAGWKRTTPVSGACPPLNVDVQRPDKIGAFLPDLDRQAVQYNQQTLTWGAVPGALPESVRCTVAVGPGAAVAAARPYGRVDTYQPELPADPKKLLSQCTLSMVDLGSVSGDDKTIRQTAAARADATLARVLAARPDNSLVMVAGLADTDQASRLHVAIADGPGWDGGWLTSPSTGRDGYVQLVDLAPTALATLNRPLPERLFVGQAATSVPGRPAELPDAVTFPADADREAGAQKNVATWFFGILAAVQLGLAITVLPLLRRARRHVGEDQTVRKPITDTVEILLVASALAIPAALIADLVPWWRGGHPGYLFAAVVVFVLAVGTAVVRLAPSFRRTLGPVSMVVTVAGAVVGLDLLTGGTLQLNGVAGYSVLEGNRYSGVGTVGLGVFITGVLLGAGSLAQRFARPWRPLVVVVVGGIGVLLVGSPYLGSDPIGAVALTAGVCIATALSTGGWLTLGRLAAASVAGVAVTAAFSWIEMRRPAGERGSLGRFVEALGDGTGGTTLQRTSKASLDALAGSPLTLLALVGAALLWLALLRNWGGLRRAYGLYPSVRAGAVGVGVAVLLGGVLGGTGLDLAGAAAAVAVPMAALTALRVLDHASDFTRPPEEPASVEVAKGVGAA